MVTTKKISIEDTKKEKKKVIKACHHTKEKSKNHKERQDERKRWTKKT